MQSPWGGHRGRRVGGVGPAQADVLLVGEAPGKDEEWGGEPFVGAAGQFLFTGMAWGERTRWVGLDGLGMSRRDMRIENVVEVRPPENQLWKVAPGVVARAQDALWQRLDALTPTVIVPVGNLALNTLRRAPLPLTKNGAWRLRRQAGIVQIDWRDKIHNWRGSIFAIRTNSGRRIKVIPTYHPAYFLHGAGEFYDVWQADWQRIAGDRLFPTLRLDPRTEHRINPTIGDARDFVAEVERAWRRDPRDAVLAGDIETVAKGQVIDCIGLSIDAAFSITLDLKQRWAWTILRAVMAHPIAKGWHYGLFDCFRLWRSGVAVRNVRWDSQQLHHHLDPRDSHRLAYCASRDLRVKFWKDEGKEEGRTASAAMTRNRPRLHRYCGKDVSRTHALIVQYRERVRARGELPIYRQHYRRLTAACLRLAQTGFRVDERARREIEQREIGVLAATRRTMSHLAGKDLVAQGGGLSSVRVNAYFYDTLKCKPFYRRGTGTRTTDELAIRRLMGKYKKARPGGLAILAYRQHAKIRQEVRQSLVSTDGRMRSRYSPTTDTGRLRASMVSRDEGINAQNRDRHSDLRRMFVADPGCVLIEWDQSQGESRIVDGMSGDRRLLALAQTSPVDLDQHVLNACKIFDGEYAEILAGVQGGDPLAIMQRDLGKRTRHATNYDMGALRMAEVALVETEGRLVLDVGECEEWLAKMHAATPGIRAYQHWIRSEVIDQEALTSSWGRTVRFTGLRITKADHKAAYAWRPQHEVGVLTNQWGFVMLDDRLQAGDWPGTQIVQQGHDSLVASVPSEWAWAVAQAVAASMGRARTYPGAGGPWTLAMPIGVKVGVNWKESKEWKVLPPRKEFLRWVQHYQRLMRSSRRSSSPR